MTSFILVAAAVSFAVLGALAPAHSQAKAEERVTEGSAINVESLAKLDNPWAMTVPAGRPAADHREARASAHLRRRQAVRADRRACRRSPITTRADCSTSRSIRTSRENELVYLSFAEAAETTARRCEATRGDQRLGQYKERRHRAQGRRGRARHGSTAISCAT